MVNEELQSLLNRSAAHVRRQGRASVDAASDNLCRYRNDNGDQCAAGIFITAYDGAMEGKTWRNVVTGGFASRLEPQAVKHSGFVAVLQAAHDNAFERAGGDFLDNYESLLRSYIERWNREHRGQQVTYPRVHS